MTALPLCAQPGDGRLILTSAGLECLRSMPIPSTPKTAKP